MNINNITDIASLSASYKGEIFVYVKNNTFDSVKDFIDTNNLIAFIENENSIYAQGHKYTGLTDEQIAAFENYATQIADINKKIKIVSESDSAEDIAASIIGNLTFGSGPDKITATNVTDFVTSVLQRIEAGDSAITESFNEVNRKIENLGTQLTNVLATVVKGDYATKVRNAADDQFIEVTLVETANAGENAELTPFIPPYTFEVKSKNIASITELQNLANSIDGKISTEIAKIVDGADSSFDTLKEIADWIQNHPDAAQMNTDIETLKTKVNELTGNLYHTETNESGETVTVLNKFTNGNLSGEEWATSLQKINEILDTVSFASNVQDNAEPNKIDQIDFAEQDVHGLTGDSTDTKVKFGTTTLDDSKNVKIELNLELLEKIKSQIISSANTYSDGKLDEAKAYVDEKLSWVII